MSNLDKLVARLEKVNEQLDKKQTDSLRSEQNDLMVEIQQLRQREREEALEASGPPDGPAPGTVAGGTGVNGE